ncbi:hypothetical protein HMPREF1624_01298 [Sporothrix schenckii ATCC 58251]|uniref:Uncharacterized protein n=2 Tax=Sporothrix schenckii TaxID=29908 RepID=U7Q542_SPOS1|nr:hypothetical protein HMPREF1624_01298 [Sporothrix schenckii ATCC 58251]
MEKRIQAVLNHLADRPIAHTTKERGASPPTTRPGVVLLHSRVLDSNKLISIAEIVKQRVREGYYSRGAEGAGATAASKKQGKKGSKLSKTSWYQYNRIYDVVSAPGAADTTPGTGDDEDDDFAPMMHRFTEAMSGKKALQGRANITTYMSIVLSRTPIAELQKNPEISVQASTDPLEVEFEQWMART